jgi:hypothetical protein
MARWKAFLVLVSLVSVIASACGESPSQPGEGDPGGGDGDQPTLPVVRGGDRIIWDQVGESFQAVSGFTFRFLVDGGQSALSDVRCSNTRSESGYPCSGQLPSLAPGRHSLQLVAIAGSQESAPSSPLLVMASSLSADEAATELEQSSMPALSGDNASCLTAGGECYDAQPIATGLGSVSALLSTPDGQVLFIEDQRHVRVVGDRGLAAEPALSIDDRSRLVGLAIPSDFERTRLVFVAWAEMIDGGRDRINVTRYREVSGTLGEGATIITGLEIPSGRAAPIAIDDQGLLYLALPTAGGIESGAPVLRFGPDGTVPATNPLFSPVIGSGGFENPSGLVWDPAGRQMWLSDRDARSRFPILTLPVSKDGRIGASLSPAVGNPSVEPDDAPVSLALTRSTQARARLWLVSQSGSVLQSPVLSQLSFTRAGFAPLGRVTAVGSGRGAHLLLGVSQSAQSGSSVWRLVPRAEARSLP